MTQICPHRLANVADHPFQRWLPREIIAQARRLSRAYDELGVDNDTRTNVPCADLLTEIATRLADIFGRSKRVEVIVSAEAILLPSDMRRALLLMGSEWIINALKYGYSTEAGGTISVSLADKAGELELVVEHDGIGLAGIYFVGQGCGLLEQLREVLGAMVTRRTSEIGHGLRVAVPVPIDMPQGADA